MLWTYRTTPQRSMRETSLSMTYGSDIVTPLETRFSTLRMSPFDADENDRLLLASLDLVDERREVVMVQLANYQQKLKQEYDKRIKTRPLAPGDLVLRRVVGTTKNPS